MSVCSKGVKWGFLKCARTAQQPRVFWLLNDTQPLRVRASLLLLCMTATAAARAAHEHNLLRTGGFGFRFFFPTSCAVCFVYNGCLNGGRYHLLFQGIKTPSTHMAQVHAGPRSQGVRVGVAAAARTRLSLTVMVKNGCYYPAVDSPQQHMLWNQLCSFASCCFQDVCHRFVCETGSNRHGYRSVVFVNC